MGITGRVEIEIPFNVLPDRPCQLLLQQGEAIEEITFPVCDQHTIQGDLFAKAIREDGSVPTSIEDAVANMQVIEALFRSAEQSAWVSLVS